MKVTSLSEVYEETTRQLLANDWDVVEWLGYNASALIVTNIYTTNDICRGFGQDYKEIDVSVISSPHRISLIVMGVGTYVKSDTTICGYESLEEDIYSILVLIQACFDKLDR